MPLPLLAVLALLGLSGGGVVTVTRAAYDVAGGGLGGLLGALAAPFAPTDAQAGGGVSADCARHSAAYLEALARLQPWAMHMYDSSTKLPSSILEGNTWLPGNYDQCLSVRAPDNGSGAFRGRHCQVDLRFLVTPPSPHQSALAEQLQPIANATPSGALTGMLGPGALLWSYCVPSSCSGRDVDVVLRARLASVLTTSWSPSSPAAESQQQLQVKVATWSCESAGEQLHRRPLQPHEWAFMGLLVACACCIVAGTACDVLCRLGVGHSTSACVRQSHRSIAGKVRAVLACFSLRRNGSALLSGSRPPSTVTCLDGMRVVCTAWVVLDHFWNWSFGAPTVDQTHVPAVSGSWIELLVHNGLIPNDTFFLLSGTVLTLSFLRRPPAPSTPSSHWASLRRWAVFYWHRYARLTPSYAVSIWFSVVVMPRLGDGPLWRTILQSAASKCESLWWSNLLYVNNLIPNALFGMCIGPSWYLATDMQLHWLSPLLLVPLVRWPRCGRALLAVLLVASVATTLAITVGEGLPPIHLNLNDSVKRARYFDAVYILPHTRAVSYLAGVALGLVLHAARPSPPRLSRLAVALGWAASVAAGLAVALVAVPLRQQPRAVLAASLCAGLQSAVFSCSLAWVVFACATGRGGPVDALLSWPPWAVLARLSYGAYLVHSFVITLVLGQQRVSSVLDMNVVVTEYLGILVLSFAAAAVLTLSFEMPFMALDHLLTGSTTTTPSTEKKQCADTIIKTESLQMDCRTNKKTIPVALE